MDFEQVENGVAVTPQMDNYLMKCCDCTLVHRMRFRAVKVVQMLEDGAFSYEELDPEEYRVELTAWRAEALPAKVCQWCALDRVGDGPAKRCPEGWRCAHLTLEQGAAMRALGAEFRPLAYIKTDEELEEYVQERIRLAAGVAIPEAPSLMWMVPAMRQMAKDLPINRAEALLKWANAIERAAGVTGPSPVPPQDLAIGGPDASNR
jgi:hypothetical protein